MSDSDDFGGFSATTPVVSRKLPTSTTTTTAGPSRTVNKGKAADAPVSIPSDDDDDDDGGVQEVPKVKNTKRGSRAASVTRTRKRGRKRDDDPEGAGDGHGKHEAKRRRNRRDEEEEESGLEEEIQEVSPPATKKARGSSRKPASRIGKFDATPNGISRGAKGKAKTKAAVAVEVDDVESLEIEEEDARMEVENLANAINASLKPTNTRTKPASRVADKGTEDECARLCEQLQQAQGHIEDLKRQMEEVHQVRMTEPEVLLQRMETQRRKEQQGTEALIRDLREQLARKDPLLRTNKNSAFELLTREEADKENQSLRDQLKTYQDAIRQRDQIIKVKDEEIVTLKTSVDNLRCDLQAEIERAKSLSSQKHPDSAPRARRGRVLGQSEDPKMAEVVRFYEDLTNLLVTDIKPQPARHLQLEDWLLTCVYSYRDVVGMGSSSAKSLSFKLRQCYEPKGDLPGEPKSKNDLIESLQYTPLELEKETEEFVKSLGFLNNPFTFERDQLALFLRTLHDVVSGDGNGDDSDGSENGIQVIEHG